MGIIIDIAYYLTFPPSPNTENVKIKNNEHMMDKNNKQPTMMAK